MIPYAGPAVVTAPDGSTIGVTARLSTRPSNVDDWAGVLSADDGVALLNVHEGRLLLPNGWESGFVRTLGGVPGGPIQVEGSTGEPLL